MSGITSTADAGIRPPTSIPATAVTNSTGATPATIVGVISTSTTSASTQTALTLSGVSGVLEFATLSNTSGSTLTATLSKITIDGVVVYSETGSILTAFAKNAVGSYGANSAIGASGALSNQPFNSSVLLEFASDGTNLAEYHYRYYLT